MVDQKIIDSVKAYLSSGRTEDEITAAMVNAGYNYPEIKEAISAARSGAPQPIVIPQAQPMQAPSSPPQPQASSSGFNFGVLPQVLYQPKQAFERIKDGVGVLSGIVIAAILVIAAQIVIRLSEASAIATLPSILTIGLTTALAVVALLFIGALSAVMAGAFGGKRNVSKTIGLLGYGYVVSVLQNVVVFVVAIVGGTALASAAPGIGVGTALAAGTGIGLVLQLVFLLWGVWVNGIAVATANGTTEGRGTAAYIIAGVVIFIIMGVVAAVAVWSWVGAMSRPAIPAGTSGLSGLERSAVPYQEIPSFIVESCVLGTPDELRLYNNGATTVNGSALELYDSNLGTLDLTGTLKTFAPGGRQRITLSGTDKLRAGDLYYVAYPGMPLVKFGC